MWFSSHFHFVSFPHKNPKETEELQWDGKRKPVELNGMRVLLSMKREQNERVIRSFLFHFSLNREKGLSERSVKKEPKSSFTIRLSFISFNFTSILLLFLLSNWNRWKKRKTNEQSELIHVLLSIPHSGCTLPVIPLALGRPSITGVRLSEENSRWPGLCFFFSFNWFSSCFTLFPLQLNGIEKKEAQRTQEEQQ